MGILDQAIRGLLNTIERAASIGGPIIPFDIQEDPREQAEEAADEFDDAIDAAFGEVFDTAEREVLDEIIAEGQLTPENVGDPVDDAEGNAIQAALAITAGAVGVEAAGGLQIESHAQTIQPILTLLILDSVLGRETEARFQEGVDPALKQQAHADHRSKQADFQDYVEANARSKAFGGEIPTRSGDIPEGLEDLLHPDDLGYLGDPDTYGTIPDQNPLFELDGLEVNEPEEIIEEPVQYGIPVPLRPVEQITELASQPEDVKEIYKEVIDQLPKTENLLQDYVRLTEFNFRLREKIEAGAIGVDQAVSLIEPELRDLIVNALPRDRYREEDRTADEVVDILIEELRRNFELLDSLPADPPSQGDLESFYRRGVINRNEFAIGMDEFGADLTFFRDYLEEQTVRKGPENIQEQVVLGRISEGEASEQLQLIGFTQQEASRIISGEDPDNIIDERLQAQDESSGLPTSVVPNIGDVRGQQLSLSGIETVTDLAQAEVETVATATDLNDVQAQQVIDAAQALLEQQAGN